MPLPPLVPHTWFLLTWNTVIIAAGKVSKLVGGVQLSKLNLEREGERERGEVEKTHFSKKKKKEGTIKGYQKGQGEKQTRGAKGQRGGSTDCPPKSCMPSRANTTMKRKSRNSKLMMDFIELSRETTRLRKDAQYLMRTEACIQRGAPSINTARSGER